MTKAMSQSGYHEFLIGLKQRIHDAHITATRAVNRELIGLYWDIGQAIAQKQAEAGWGDSVVERLAGDLRLEFPGMRGFSADNLWRMRQFFFDYTESGFLEQLAPEMAPGEPGTLVLEQPVPEMISSQQSEYHLQTQLPKELKGKLPTAQQLARVVREALPKET